MYALNIGLDIHKTIDAYPSLFKFLTKTWIHTGYSVHIMTGESGVTAIPQINELSIQRTHFFSIIDYHRETNDVNVRQDNNGNIWMDEHTWNITKGEYARRNCIDVMFDDSEIYGQYFPSTCTYIQIPPIGFEKVCKELGLIYNE